MRLEVVPNVFPADFAGKIYEHCKNAKFVYGWKSTSEGNVPGHWNASFVDSGPANGLDLTDKLEDPIIKEAWHHVQQRYPEMILLRCYANLHTYGIEGYPHRDSGRESDFTLVVYMTPNWRLSWAGETQLFKDGEIYFSQIPKFNTGIFFPGQELHVARGVTRMCQAPRITLMFKMALRDADPARDAHQRYLERIGAGEKNHTGRTLADHLLQTYDLLKYAKCPQSVCLAGGSHSLLGTNAFQEVTLDTPEKRDELHSRIGDYAYGLVQKFSDIKRPETIEGNMKTLNQPVTVALTRNDGGTEYVSNDVFYDLACLEAANLHDQYILNRYPQLAELWRQKGFTVPK